MLGSRLSDGACRRQGCRLCYRSGGRSDRGGLVRAGRAGRQDVWRSAKSFAPLRLIRLDRAPRQEEVLRLYVSAFGAQLPQLGSTGFYYLFLLQDFLACLCGPRRLGFTLATRCREVLFQPLGPLTLLLQIRQAALPCRCQPGQILGCFGYQRSLGLDVAPRCRQILLQPRGSLALLLQVSSGALACCLQSGCLLDRKSVV